MSSRTRCYAVGKLPTRLPTICKLWERLERSWIGVVSMNIGKRIGLSNWQKRSNLYFDRHENSSHCKKEELQVRGSSFFILQMARTVRFQRLFVQLGVEMQRGYIRALSHTAFWRARQPLSNRYSQITPFQAVSQQKPQTLEDCGSYFTGFTNIRISL